MPPSQPITEISIYQMQEGIGLQDTSTNKNSVKLFQDLTQTAKAQPGFIRQFHGHQVETPTLFVWLIEWDSLEAHTALHASGSTYLSSIREGLTHLFDIKTSPPVTLLIRTDSPSSALTALRSGVTEVAFFTLPSRPSAAGMAEISAGSVDSLELVETVGKATGSTIGWVLDARPRSLVEDDGNAVAMYGVFGYQDIETHMVWRETPEGKAAGEAAKGYMRPSVEVPGVDAEKGYFHVHFREGS